MFINVWMLDSLKVWMLDKHFTSVFQTFPNIILAKFEMLGNVLQTFGVTRAVSPFKLGSIGGSRILDWLVNVDRPPYSLSWVVYKLLLFYSQHSSLSL